MLPETGAGEQSKVRVILGLLKKWVCSANWFLRWCGRWRLNVDPFLGPIQVDWS